MPIHLFWGDDIAASDKAIEDLIKKVINPSLGNLNLSRLDGTDTCQVSQALQEVRTPPFGTGDRLVVLKRSPFCNGCSSDLAKSFEDVLELIPSNTHFVLSNPNKPDGRLKTTKAIQSLIKKKQVYERSFILPAFWDEAGQRKLVTHTADNLGLELDSEATSLLVKAIGNNSERLYSELKKLSLLAEKKYKVDNSKETKICISSSTVKALIDGMTTNAIQIGESLLENNLGEALMRLNALLETGEPPLRILATVTSQIRGWLWISLLEQQRELDVSIIAKAAGINNPKRVYILRKQLKGKSPKRFLQLLNCLLEIESAIKRGVMPADAFRDGLLSDHSFE